MRRTVGMSELRQLVLLILLNSLIISAESSKYCLINPTTFYQADSISFCQICQSHPEYIIILMSWLGSCGPRSFVCWRASWGVWRNKERSLEHEAFSARVQMVSSPLFLSAWEAVMGSGQPAVCHREHCSVIVCFNCYYVHGIQKVALDIYYKRMEAFARPNSCPVVFPHSAPVTFHSMRNLFLTRSNSSKRFIY